jgi:shikimate kinase
MQLSKGIPGPTRIFLVGFMGSGKTHWGRIWAKETGLKFFDLDEVIESETQMTITEIFEAKGESAFREMERYRLQEFGKQDHFILACGGGTPCFLDNLTWMKSVGTVLYLKALPEVIRKNVLDERHKRPLIKEIDSKGLLPFIQEKLKEREAFYLGADRVIEVETLDGQSLTALMEETE